MNVHIMIEGLLYIKSTGTPPKSKYLEATCAGDIARVTEFSLCYALPSFSEIKVKDKKSTKGGRHILQLKGISSKMLSRQNVLLPASIAGETAQKAAFFFEESIKKGPLTLKQKAWSILNSLPQADKIEIQDNTAFISFSSPILCLRGMEYPFVLTGPDKKERTVRGICIGGETTINILRKQKCTGKSLKEILHTVAETELDYRSVTASYPDIPHSVFEKKDAEYIPPFFVLKKAGRSFYTHIIDAASKPGGIEKETLCKKMDIPYQLFSGLLNSLKREGSVQIREGFITAKKSHNSSGDLPPFLKTCYNTLHKLGSEGKRRNSLKPWEEEGYKQLIRMGVVYVLGHDILIATEVYEKLKMQLLSSLHAGDTVDISTAKQKTGLSRKKVLLLMQSLEQEGLLKNSGNKRTVLHSGNKSHSK